MTLTVKRPETRVPFCLDGDLKAAHEAADAEYVRANTKRLADPRLGDSTRSLAQKVLDLEAQMQEATVSFVVRGLPRGKWADLKVAHPPRDENETDKSYGFNVESIMTEAIPASVVRVENQAGEALPFTPADEWEALADDMTDSQYGDFVLAVLRVNAGRNDVPFSLSAFRMTQDSAQM
jgi:hypothetical protein